MGTRQAGGGGSPRNFPKQAASSGWKVSTTGAGPKGGSLGTFAGNGQSLALGSGGSKTLVQALPSRGPSVGDSEVDLGHSQPEGPKRQGWAGQTAWRRWLLEGVLRYSDISYQRFEEQLPRQKPGGLVSGADEKGLGVREREAVWGPGQTLRAGDREFLTINIWVLSPVPGWRLSSVTNCQGLPWWSSG